MNVPSLPILLTCDDGLECPFLAPLAESLSKASFCSDLLLVIPDEEQSWISQAISRSKRLTTKPFVLGEANGFTVNGTPADCASLGIFQLSKLPPKLVISGINMGTNAGMGFYYNSGTIGAARQAAASGVKAFSFSCFMPMDIFFFWLRREQEALAGLSESWQRLAQTATAIVAELLPKFLESEVDVLAIDLPWGAEPTTPRVFTRLERYYYNAIFREVAPGEYQLHPGEEMIRRPQEALALEGNGSSNQELPTDFATVKSGKVSITPILLDRTGADWRLAKTLTSDK